MSKPLYHQLYKCRMCGKEYCPVTTYDEEATISNMCSYINKGNGISNEYTMPYSATLYEIHYCENGSFGVADFIGYVKDGESYD